MAHLMRMLVTRPEPDAQATQDRLAALGIEGSIAPLMVRQNVDATVPPGAFAGVAITSTNALRSLEDQNLIERFRDCPTFAVGDRTAYEARALGFSNVVAADGTLPSLVTTIALSRNPGPIFYAAGRHLSGDLGHALAPHGILVATATVYEMVSETNLPAGVIEDLQADRYGAVLFYSRRTAEIFCSLAQSIELGKRRTIPMLCMSEKVAEPLLENHFSRVLLSDYPSEDAMMALALAFAREQTGA